MSQQPYYPPQYPQQPQQAPTPQQFTQPQFPQQAQPYAPQGYPQQPQQAPAQPLATGTLDDYYSQPSSGGGPSISWSANGFPKPEGTTYAGIVARDVTNADIQQQTDPKTGQPKFYRDGRPQFVMKVPLKVQPSQEHPEGEATLFVRGQMRDELVRAMGEAGVEGAPKGGDALTVTLVQRKPSRGGGNPMNVFSIRYQPAQGSGAPSPAPEPASQAAPAPAQQHVQQAPPQQFQQQVPLPETAQQPVQQQAPAQAQQQAQPQGQQPAQAPQPPSDLSPEQQQLLARLTGGNQQ